MAPYQTLRCADVPIAVACGNDGQFARLAAVVGRPDLAVDPRFLTNGDRVTHQPALELELEAALALDTAAAWETKLVAVQVPAGLVGTVGEALDRARFLELEPLIDLGPDQTPQVRHPVRYSSTPAASATPPPGLGEHDALVTEWLAGPSDATLPASALTPLKASSRPAPEFGCRSHRRRECQWARSVSARRAYGTAR